jgi:hypothetical protein
MDLTNSQAKRLAADLITQAREATSDNVNPAGDTGIKVPSEIRKAKIAEVNDLLERECVIPCRFLGCKSVLDTPF